MWLKKRYIVEDHISHLISNIIVVNNAKCA